MEDGNDRLGAKIDLGWSRQLIALEAVPEPHLISDIAISGALNGPAPFDERRFASLLQTAVLIDPADPIFTRWHYSPLCEVTFKTEDGQYHLRLFLGGLGFLKVPTGAEGALMLPAEALRPR